jgi:hypothetical protein
MGKGMASALPVSHLFVESLAALDKRAAAKHTCAVC